MQEDSWLVDEVDDDGTNRTQYQILKCPMAEQCSANAFKRAGCCSMKDADTAKERLMFHLIRSSLHYLTKVQAKELADLAEVEETVETWADRDTYREEHAKKLEAQKKQAEDWKANGTVKGKKGKGKGFKGKNDGRHRQNPYRSSGSAQSWSPQDGGDHGPNGAGGGGGGGGGVGEWSPWADGQGGPDGGDGWDEDAEEGYGAHAAAQAKVQQQLESLQQQLSTLMDNRAAVDGNTVQIADSQALAVVSRPNVIGRSRANGHGGQLQLIDQYAARFGMMSDCLERAKQAALNMQRLCSSQGTQFQQAGTTIHALGAQFAEEATVLAAAKEQVQDIIRNHHR